LKKTPKFRQFFSAIIFENHKIGHRELWSEWPDLAEISPLERNIFVNQQLSLATSWLYNLLCDHYTSLQVCTYTHTTQVTVLSPACKKTWAAKILECKN
jgi:hypothetical protein